jgi:hypothetical protein
MVMVDGILKEVFLGLDIFIGLWGTDLTGLQNAKEVLGVSTAFTGCINIVVAKRERERVMTPEIALFLSMF